MVADDRVALVAELVEILVVDPDVLGELELAHEAGADDEGGDAALRPVVGCAFGEVGAVGGAAADHAAAVHVRRGVARVHPADVRAQIDAAEDFGASGWMLWGDPQNVTVEALEPEPST